MCIYINNFEKHEDPQYYLQSLQPFLEIFSKQHKKLIEVKDKDDDDVTAELEKLKKTHAVVQLMLREHQKKTVDLRNMFNGAKKKNEQIWTELQVKLKDTEQSTKQMLRTLLEIDDEEVASASKPNEDIFFKPFDYEVLSDEQRKFVDLVRRNFNFVDDVELAAKDVRDVLKAELSERLIIKMQETMVLEEAWKKGSVKVKNLCKV
jgi:carboxypeptidase C (cathepsin A)